MRRELDGAEFGKPDPAPVPEPSREALVREQLDRILASPGFQGATRRARLLRFLVEEVLLGRGDSLKELVIATEVFERAPDYNPQVDSLVRVEMGRLRSRLQEYYAQAGADEPVRIDIPKGAYRPVFVFRDAPAETMPEPPAESAPTGQPWWRQWRWAAAGLAGAGLLAGVVWLLRTSAAPLPKSIAVLPFLNLSGDPASEYLGDGISEELTESLAQSPDLRVVSRTSAFQYKGKSPDVREIGRKLGARAVLEGSVGRRGEGLHVVAQLIRSSDGYHLWSEAYDAGVSELPSVEARIGQAVRENLSPTPSPAAVKDSRKPEDPEAHDLYLRAAYQFNLRTVASVRRAIELARQAVQKDPGYAQPHVLMASCESQLSTLFAEAPREASARAREDIGKALELDPGNSGAHALLAMLTYADQWDWPRAEHEFRLALATGSHGSAENLYGWCLMTRGRFAEARRHLEIAAELDPLSLGPQLNQVEEMIAERNYQEARRKVDQILETAPDNFVALALASSVALYSRDCPTAVSLREKMLATFPQSPYAHLSALAVDAFCGHPERVAGEMADILSGHPPGYLSPYSLATAYAAGGDAGRAMSYLQKSADLREPTILMLKIERVFDRMRQDQGFLALERQIGLMD
jgi:TolB-like protein/Tfp pilus assembly protein PilF